MKPFHIVLAVVGGMIVLIVAIFLIVDVSSAQTPAPYPDVDLARQGTTYGFQCQPVEPIDKMVSMCAARTDLPDGVIELGCVDATAIDAVQMTITLDRTPHVDASIRCYAVDSEGNVSDYSENIGIADFTPNGKPHVK